ncbi:GNAT family N-acetyltransferase [Peribacillus sp. SCS-155]|uniref:GNAT family N-acetyltransferase n=1 Tax=Peribacillus sedimenti TaxID=3115297 RepID=UPI003906B8D0
MENNKELVIKEMKSEKDWLKAFPVMKQLRTHLDEPEYLTLVKGAAEENGYVMYALFEENKVAAVIGFMPMTTLYNGKFIWVCDLVTDYAMRSLGYGQKLLEFIEDWSTKEGYKIISLSSGLQRRDAHRFYENKVDFDKVSYVFLKRL